MNDSWQKLSSDIHPQMSGLIAKIRLLVGYSYESAENLHDFAVFRGMEFPENQHAPTDVVYFSPVAAPLCAADMERLGLSFQPCDAPSRDAAGLQLLYARDPELAWALLK